MKEMVYVPISVEIKPEQDGCYMTKWKGVPAFTEKYFENGEWQSRFFDTGLMTHWLKPIPLSELIAPLIEALESLAEQKYTENIFKPVSIDDFNSIKNYCEQVLGFPIDRLSAHYGRIFQKIFSDQAAEALKQYK